MAGLLAIAAAGIVVTAAFPTQTSAGVLPAGVVRSAGGRLHDLGSGVAILALAAAMPAGAGLVPSRRFRGLTAALAAPPVLAGVVLLAVGNPVDGVRQRIMVAAALVWLAGLLATLPGHPGSGRERTT